MKGEGDQQALNNLEQQLHFIAGLTLSGRISPEEY